MQPVEDSIFYLVKFVYMTLMKKHSVKDVCDMINALASDALYRYRNAV